MNISNGVITLNKNRSKLWNGSDEFRHAILYVYREMIQRHSPDVDHYILNSQGDILATYLSQSEVWLLPNGKYLVEHDTEDEEQ